MVAITRQLTLDVNGDRLNASIERLAEIGKLSQGGIRRLAFTLEDQKARSLVQRWMQEAGMIVRIDTAGNLIGRYEGKIPHAPALATGSHIDTVPLGGKYDGVLGVLAGIEVVRTLNENRIRLNHPVEVIVFADEESSMIGAQGMAGTVKAAEYIHPPNDEGSIESCLENIGGDWNQIHTAVRSRDNMAAFVELHVEQGGVLDSQDKAIGVVLGVVGMHRYAIRVTGTPNHAGTTPMDQRQDALVAASQIVLAVQKLALDAPGAPVATVGSLEVFPNAANIVPGQVQLTVDMRDLSPDCLALMTKRLHRALNEIARQTNTEIEIEPILVVEPSPAAQHVQNVIEQTCQELNLSYCHLPSRAGHDAMEMGRITDMGMIFVPSHQGISHSEAEYTSPEQCTQGANVLLYTLMKLDQAYR
ncbi:MAG: Zn-dependent hydrolase [Thainema sp.]